MRRMLIAIAAGLGMASCAVTREQKLERQADRVESRLVAERDRVLELSAADPGRTARLDHLSGLKATLSAANVARGLVPQLMEESQRGVAYDVLEETYSTIEWNIPLDPRSQAARPLPAGFNGGTLNLGELLR